jgi:hypothetical protein
MSMPCITPLVPSVIAPRRLGRGGTPATASQRNFGRGRPRIAAGATGELFAPVRSSSRPASGGWHHASARVLPNSSRSPRAIFTTPARGYPLIFPPVPSA